MQLPEREQYILSHTVSKLSWLNYRFDGLPLFNTLVWDEALRSQQQNLTSVTTDITLLYGAKYISTS